MLTWKIVGGAITFVLLLAALMWLFLSPASRVLACAVQCEPNAPKLVAGECYCDLNVERL